MARVDKYDREVFLKTSRGFLDLVPRTCRVMLTIPLRTLFFFQTPAIPKSLPADNRKYSFH